MEDTINRNGSAAGQYRETDAEDNVLARTAFSRLRFKCGCGQPNCWIPSLLDLRSHCAALFRAIVSLGYSERIANTCRQDDPLPGVINALSMAGGIESFVANPAFVNDSEASLWCGTAWEAEKEERAYASAYAEGLVVFNFIWNAYEAAIESSSDGKFGKDKIPVQARRLMAAESEQAGKVRNMGVLYRAARHFCLLDDRLKKEIAASESKYKLEMPAAAAELVRIYRNHVLHGREAPPIYNMDPCWRLHTIERLLLVLIQYLVLRMVVRPRQRVLLSINHEELGAESADQYLRNLHYEDKIWRNRRRDTAKRRKSYPERHFRRS